MASHEQEGISTQTVEDERPPRSELAEIARLGERLPQARNE